MNEKLFLLLFLLSFVDIASIKHSEQIWKKFMKLIEEKKISLESKFYFLYDETNILSDEKMKNINTLQKYFYSRHDVKNYIFLIDTLSGDSIDDLTLDLSHFIGDDLVRDLADSIFTVISIRNKLIKIQLGPRTYLKYHRGALDVIIPNLNPYLKDGDFYELCNKLMEYLEIYYDYFYTSNV